MAMRDTMLRLQAENAAKIRAQVAALNPPPAAIASMERQLAEQRAAIEAGMDGKFGGGLFGAAGNLINKANDAGLVKPLALGLAGAGALDAGGFFGGGSASAGGTAAAAPLGSGISIMPAGTSTAIGGGGLGSGLTLPVGAPSIGGGALGTGLSGGMVAGTSLAPGFFAAETLPTLASPGVASVGASAPGVTSAGGATTAGGAAGSGGIIDKFLSSPQLLGAAAGGLLGGLGGGAEQAGTITVEEGIPDWLIPYVKPQLDQYSSLLQNHQTDPYGIMPEAMQQFRDTISGQFLDPSTNKWLEQYYNLGAERVKGSLSPSFGHMQAFGSHSGYNEALSRGLGDLAVNLYGGAYERERDRQNQMIAAAPNFLTGASQSAFAPFSQYLSTVGNLGKKREEPFFEDKFSSTLGGAMAGFGLGGLFK